MKALRFLFFVSGAMGFLVALNACFTEVGNPEDEATMTAAFQVDYTPDSIKSIGAPDSIRVTRFPFVLDSVSYLDSDSTSGSLWQSQLNHPFDFTGGSAPDSLPPQALKKGTLEELHLPLRFSTGSDLRVDTLNFQTFANPGYMKGLYSLGDSTVEFLFAFPDSADLNLRYSLSTLEKWHTGSVYRCMFRFYAFGWLSKIDLRNVVKVKDKSNQNVVIFNSQNNSALYDSLDIQFYKSFNTQQTY